LQFLRHLHFPEKSRHPWRLVETPLETRERRAAPRVNALFTVELNRDIFAFGFGRCDFPSC
jgi:hypothetical protein